MKIVMRASERGPQNKVAEGELVFDKGPLAGLKLVGFDVWRKQDGDLFLALPGRAYEKDGQRKTFDYLRAQSRDELKALDRLKGEMLAEARRVLGASTDPEEEEGWA